MCEIGAEELFTTPISASSAPSYGPWLGSVWTVLPLLVTVIRNWQPEFGSTGGHCVNCGTAVTVAVSESVAVRAAPEAAGDRDRAKERALRGVRVGAGDAAVARVVAAGRGVDGGTVAPVDRDPGRREEQPGAWLCRPRRRTATPAWAEIESAESSWHDNDQSQRNGGKDSRKSTAKAANRPTHSSHPQGTPQFFPFAARRPQAPTPPYRTDQSCAIRATCAFRFSSPLAGAPGPGSCGPGAAQSSCAGRSRRP